MPVEIERKFLVKESIASIIRDQSYTTAIITQQYLDKTGDWTIRTRQCVNTENGNNDYYLTLKRKITDVSCTEIELEIDRNLYFHLLATSGKSLRKTRYSVMHNGNVWEIDCFSNEELDDLVIAEIELPSENTVFDKPSWVGEEVTYNKKYKNAKLVKRLKR